MHEAGIAYQIIRLVESVCREHQLTRVARVTVELGEVSGVVEDYLTSVWNWAVKKNELLKGAELRFEQIDAVTICNSCGRTYPTIPQGKQCPNCHSYDTVLLHGNEFLIREIEAC